MTKFIDRFRQYGDYSLRGMRKTAIALLPKDRAEQDALHEELNRGRDALEDENLLNMYLYSYGKMHKFKLIKAFMSLFEHVDFGNEEIEIYDWGCGQGLATMCFLDCLEYLEIKPNIKGIFLIDQSFAATNRASGVIKCKMIPCQIITIDKGFDFLNNTDFVSSDTKKLHLFSNILDVESYDLSHFVNFFHRNFFGDNYIVCVGPCYNMERLEEFLGYIEPDANYCSLAYDRGEWVNDWSIALQICYKHIAIPRSLASHWIDNYGAKYSHDWKQLLEGPNTKVVETMIINKNNFQREDLWVSRPIISRATGNTVYWCSFHSFENDTLLYLSKRIWENMSIVNIDTVWEVLSSGKYIIREARDINTNEWIMTNDNQPVMMITESQHYVHADWDTDYTYFKYRELDEAIEYSIKPGTSYISDNAFSCCKSLQIVTIPESVESVGNDIFKGCDSLKEINIPHGTFNKYARLLPQYENMLVEEESLVDDLPF